MLGRHREKVIAMRELRADVQRLSRLLGEYKGERGNELSKLAVQYTQQSLALEESILSSAAHFTSAVLICPSWSARHAAMAKKISARGIGLAIVICSEPQSKDFPPSAQVRIMQEARP